MKKYISFVFMSIFLLGILAACGTDGDVDNAGENTEEKKVLTMGTSADYKPFEYIDTAKGSEIIGIDPEIGRAVAERLGYELDIRDMEFNGLITALQNSQVDFVMAAMSATEERKKSVDFSDIYYESKHIVASKKDSGIETVEDLKGKRVGAQLGSIQEEKARELAEEIGFTVDSRNRIPELIQEIMAGRMDAAIIENTSAEGYLANNPDVDNFTIEDAEGGFAIAFPKGSELREAFNKELQTMIETGEIDAIVSKYYNE